MHVQIMVQRARSDAYIGTVGQKLEGKKGRRLLAVAVSGD